MNPTPAGPHLDTCVLVSLFDDESGNKAGEIWLAACATALRRRRRELRSSRASQINHGGGPSPKRRTQYPPRSAALATKTGLPVSKMEGTRAERPEAAGVRTSNGFINGRGTSLAGFPTCSLGQQKGLVSLLMP
jgi:hypothetical protein